MNTPVDNNDQPQNYFLAAVTLTFKVEDGMAVVPVNVLCMNNSEQIDQHMLGLIQQGAAANLFQKMEGQPHQVIDVVIMNIVKLGVFTAEEFRKRMDLEDAANAIREASSV